jgi:hypothetical protein
MRVRGGWWSARALENGGDVEVQRAVGVDRLELAGAEVGDRFAADDVPVGALSVDRIVQVAVTEELPSCLDRWESALLHGGTAIGTHELSGRDVTHLLDQPKAAPARVQLGAVDRAPPAIPPPCHVG